MAWIIQTPWLWTAVRNLYVSDSSNNRVLRFDTTDPGEFTYLPLLTK